VLGCDKQVKRMADDFDVEAMLEETYRRQVSERVVIVLGKACLFVF